MTKFSIAIASHRLDQRLRNTITMVRNCINYGNYEICLHINGVQLEEDVKFHGGLVDKYDYSPEKSNVSRSKNAAISLANNEWVVLLDSDDFLVPSALKIYESAIKENTDMQVAFEYSAINLFKKPKPTYSYPPTFVDFEGYVSAQLEQIPKIGACGHATLINKDSEFRFNEGFTFAEERKLASDIWAKQFVVHVLRSATYVYNWNENGISYNVTEKTTPEQERCKMLVMEQNKGLNLDVRALELPFMTDEDRMFIQRAYELERICGSN